MMMDNERSARSYEIQGDIHRALADIIANRQATEVELLMALSAVMANVARQILNSAEAER